MKNGKGKESASGPGSGPGGGIAPPKNGEFYRILAYLRVSKEEAETGSHTLSTQEMRIQERLSQLLGRQPHPFEVTVIKDDGVSGGYGPEATGIEKRIRKSLLTVRSELKTGIYDLFAVYNTDRFARSARWFLQMLEDDILPYALFLSVTEDLDFTTPEGRAMAGVFAVVNTMFRDRIIARNLDAVAMRTQLGYFQGHVPYGWKWQPRSELPERGGRRRILPVPEQGRIIIQMKDWYLAGLSLQKIARKLDEMGVPTPITYKPELLEGLTSIGRPPRGLWNYSAVQKLLKSPVHAGLINSKRYGLVRGEHWESRYYDPEVREQMLATFASRKSFARTNTGGLNDTLLLNGLPRCARCGDRLHPTTLSARLGERRMYRCFHSRYTGQKGCEGVSVGEVDLDNLVVGLLERIAAEPQMMDLLIAEAEKAAGMRDEQLVLEQEQLAERLKDLDNQSERLMSALGRGILDDEEFKRHNTKVRAERGAISSRLSEVEEKLLCQGRRSEESAKVRDMVLQFPKAWQHLDLMERREVVRQLVESITVDRDEEESSPRKNGNVTSVITIKVALLPEQTFRVSRSKRPRLEKTQMGFAGLSPRQLAYLHWISEKKSRDEIAVLMGIQRRTLQVLDNVIRKRVKMWDMEEIARCAGGFIRAKKAVLPLEGAVGIHSGAHEHAEEGKTDPRIARAPFYLSPKLIEVLVYFAGGAVSKEIAQITGLPLSTVTGRRQSILEITRAKSIYEAVQKAKEAGYL